MRRGAADRAGKPFPQGSGQLDRHFQFRLPTQRLLLFIPQLPLPFFERREPAAGRVFQGKIPAGRIRLLLRLMEGLPLFLLGRLLLLPGRLLLLVGSCPCRFIALRLQLGILLFPFSGLDVLVDVQRVFKDRRQLQGCLDAGHSGPERLHAGILLFRGAVVPRGLVPGLKFPKKVLDGRTGRGLFLPRLAQSFFLFPRRFQGCFRFGQTDRQVFFLGYPGALQQSVAHLFPRGGPLFQLLRPRPQAFF